MIVINLLLSGHKSKVSKPVEKKIFAFDFCHLFSFQVKLDFIFSETPYFPIIKLF